ncbi:MULTISPECIES: SH3 domain-containing protein [unclassified Campylobacter]|uniref:SH3 domain-containing protein n=1 Tax=unclassified Campylobacter TaxID=2593542 RepID=UPI002D7EB376|nr:MULTISPECIES: SH3 domain-containing protein [unclassified Campylobacter]
MSFLIIKVLAQDNINNLQIELKNLPEEEQKIYKNIAPSDESEDYQKNIEDPFIPQSSLVLITGNYINKAYVGEVFPITIYAKTTENTNFNFHIEFIKNNDLLFLNPDVKWERKNDVYEATLWFEAKTSNANLEQIIIKLSRNNVFFQKANIAINPIKFENTPSSNNFSHLVASSLEIKKIKTNYFDDKNVIMIMELNATNTNLKSFYLKGIEKQGIENLKGDFNSSNAYYYAVFPVNKNIFSFSYFNKDEKKLQNYNLKIKVSEDSISTQSDLNPTNKDFNIYKQYGLWIIAFLLGICFVFKKNYIILVFALICFISGFLIDTSTKIGILKANAKARILPTELSTYFYTTNNNEKVEILGERKPYIKVLFKDGKIGWVENEDLAKN